MNAVTRTGGLYLGVVLLGLTSAVPVAMAQMVSPTPNTSAIGKDGGVTIHGKNNCSSSSKSDGSKSTVTTGCKKATKTMTPLSMDGMGSGSSSSGAGQSGASGIQSSTQGMLGGMASGMRGGH